MGLRPLKTHPLVSHRTNKQTRSICIPQFYLPPFTGAGHKTLPRGSSTNILDYPSVNTISWANIKTTSFRRQILNGSHSKGKSCLHFVSPRFVSVNIVFWYFDTNLQEKRNHWSRTKSCQCYVHIWNESMLWLNVVDIISTVQRYTNTITCRHLTLYHVYLLKTSRKYCKSPILENQRDHKSTLTIWSN